MPLKHTSVVCFCSVSCYVKTFYVGLSTNQRQALWKEFTPFLSNDAFYSSQDLRRFSAFDKKTWYLALRYVEEKERLRLQKETA